MRPGLWVTPRLITYYIFITNELNLYTKQLIRSGQPAQPTQKSIKTKAKRKLTTKCNRIVIKSHVSFIANKNGMCAWLSTRTNGISCLNYTNQSILCIFARVAQLFFVPAWGQSKFRVFCLVMRLDTRIQIGFKTSYVTCPISLKFFWKTCFFARENGSDVKSYRKMTPSLILFFCLIGTVFFKTDSPGIMIHSKQIINDISLYWLIYFDIYLKWVPFLSNHVQDWECISDGYQAHEYHQKLIHYALSLWNYIKNIN